MSESTQVTNCLNCNKEVAGSGPALCEDCTNQGLALCSKCEQRVSNGTTPYCNQCAEEILGTG